MVCFIFKSCAWAKETKVPLLPPFIPGWILCERAASFMESHSAELEETEVRSKHPTSSNGGTARGMGADLQPSLRVGSTDSWRG